MNTAVVETLPPTQTLAALSLIMELCEQLEANDINYCHWKSNNVIALSANGENDLDLLISRADLHRFSRIVDKLDFKEAIAPTEKRLPGVMDFYGFDIRGEKLVHLHVHYQLILGHDLSKNYRLPVEAAYLDSAVQKGMFKLPAPEFEYIVFVIRMILKHVTWDTMLIKHGKLSSNDRTELVYLQAKSNQNSVSECLTRNFPYLDMDLFEKGERSLEAGCGWMVKITTGRAFVRALGTCARRNRSLDIALKFKRRLTDGMTRLVSKSTPKRQLSSGGSIIAFIGGDGAGKSTVIANTFGFLSKHFDVKQIHLGKPPRSWTTWLVRSVLKIGSLMGFYPYIGHAVRYSFKDATDREIAFPGFSCLIREACTARDRYLLYRKAFRISANGGLVLSDRFPIEHLTLMDGAAIKQMAGKRRAHWFIKWLISLEEWYYKRIVSPDVLIVLKLDPDIAVSRKTEEDEIFVRTRSGEVWTKDWQSTSAHVVDTSRPLDEILSESRVLIWNSL